MRDVVLQMGISIDGVVSGGPGTDIGGGEPEHDDVVARKLGWVSSAGVHAMGRKSYQEMAGFWPTAEGAYAAPMNAIPKVVFSKTLDRADWPTTTIASGPLDTEIAKLKAEPGGDILVYGGYTLAQALTRADLVDVYRLVIRPAALGSGEPMFKNLSAELRFIPTDSTVYPDGTVITVYRRRR
jgi:dihydrofolate reductase